jgi:hypothetical protein
MSGQHAKDRTIVIQYARIFTKCYGRCGWVIAKRSLGNGHRVEVISLGVVSKILAASLQKGKPSDEHQGDNDAKLEEVKPTQPVNLRVP